MTKAARERARYWPITHGNYTLDDVAALWAQGERWESIAALWGLRPRAGADDLRFDVYGAWERAGGPGGLPAPAGYGPEHAAAWDAWRIARDAAVPTWLMSLIVGGVPSHHCSTCQCREPANGADPGVSPQTDDGSDPC